MSTNGDLFAMTLSDWLFDSSGSGHKSEIRFEPGKNLTCDTPAPSIQATKVKFAYLLFDGPEEHVPAKRHIEQLIADSGLPGSFSFVKVLRLIVVTVKKSFLKLFQKFEIFLLLQSLEPIGENECECKALQKLQHKSCHIINPSINPIKSFSTYSIKPSAFANNFTLIQVYAAWETDEIIGYELWRNIGLALAAIFTVVIILLANIRISLMVFLTVVLTLVDIVGFLHWWNITIDIISCVNIVLAVGLCVDYSVHIGHAFIVASGRVTN